MWVAGGVSVARIDPETRAITATISDLDGPSDVAAGEGAVWVANGSATTVSRIDTRTNRVTDTIELRNRPAAIAAGAGRVWVTVY